MNTPITDALGNSNRHAPLTVAYLAMAQHAEKLELDRAALMAWMREIANADPIDLALDPQWAQRIAKAALAAARANFP